MNYLIFVLVLSCGALVYGNTIPVASQVKSLILISLNKKFELDFFNFLKECIGRGQNNKHDN